MSIAGCANKVRRPAEAGSTSISQSNLPHPRLDYKFIAENEGYISTNALNRAARVPTTTVPTIVRLYNDLKSLSGALNRKLALHNTASTLVRDTTLPPAKDEAIREAKRLKEEIFELKTQVSTTETRLLHCAASLPNITHPNAPIGSETDAVILSIHGPDPLPPTPLRDHVQAARVLQMLDLEAGSTVTGNSWYFLLNEGVLLELALVNYALTVAIKHGFKPVMTPDVVKEDIASRCGFEPRDPTNVQQMYHLASESEKDHPALVLAGTAEIPLAGYFANKIMEESQLPQKVVGIGKAFRAEAGARGTDTRGLYRVHQFTKVELFAVGAEIQSDDLLEDLRKVQVDILDGLNFPFRVLDMPTEELGASAYRKYDIEAWMPGRGRWGEVTSSSNCTDYQSRRLHIRYRRKVPWLEPNLSVSSQSRTVRQSAASDVSHEKQPLPFAHTLNGTAAAIPRLIVALLENGVRLKGGEVVGLDLPNALRPFWLGDSKKSVCDLRWV